MRKSVWFFCLLPFVTTAQSVEPTYERDYKRAVAQFKAENYVAALEDFAPLTLRKYQHSLAPYSHYYYALSAQRLNRLTESRQMLLQLRERFPNWKKMDEVRYLLADLSFREKQYGEALDYLSQISETNLKKEAENLKRYYINQLQDLAYLKSLNRQYPSDRTIAVALVGLIQRISNEKSDLELSDQLTNRFGVAPVKNNSSTVTPIRQTSNFDKGYYNVAVVLPFRLKEFAKNNRVRSNQFAFDMYEGLKIAKQKLQQEGILVNLFCYDVGSDADEMLAVVNNANFAQTDFIFGPVYPEPAKLAADFAETHGRFFLHPTTLTTEILADHANTLLLQPSFERQAQEGFDFMKSVSAVANRKIAIYFGSSRRDSTLAAAYHSKASSEGYQIIDYRKTREKLDTVATIAEWNKPAHVALFVSHESEGAKVLSMLNKRRINSPLLTTATGFNLANCTPATFSGRATYMIDTEFIDNNKPQVRDFQQQYLAKRNTIPSFYVMQAYDALLFFGRMLHKYKNQLRSGLDRQIYEEDYLLWGFDYRKSSDNQQVPIIKIEDMRWTVANRK
ncbi:MAG: amino acid ABC transporter substrate-binding protein [Runella sp.]